MPGDRLQRRIDVLSEIGKNPTFAERVPLDFEPSIVVPTAGRIPIHAAALKNAHDPWMQWLRQLTNLRPDETGVLIIQPWIELLAIDREQDEPVKVGIVREALATQIKTRLFVELAICGLLRCFPGFDAAGRKSPCAPLRLAGRTAHHQDLVTRPIQHTGGGGSLVAGFALLGVGDRQSMTTGLSGSQLGLQIVDERFLGRRVFKRHSRPHHSAALRCCSPAAVSACSARSDAAACRLLFHL
jgi:hypothetical protein